MRTSALSTVLSVLAVVGVTALFLRVERLAEQVRPLSQGRQNAVREGVEADGPSRAPAAAARRESPVAAAEEGAGTQAPGDAGDDEYAAPATLEERLARVEQRQDRLEQDGFGGLRHDRVIRRFAGSVDELATELNLTAAQRDRVSDAVARGRRRVEEVLKIPDEDGKSPHERREEHRKKLEETLKTGNPGGVLSFAFASGSHVDKKIPGRNTTYGAEIERIKKETREEIAGNLDPDQRKLFENTHIDPLLDEGGPLTTFAVSITSDSLELPADGG